MLYLMVHIDTNLIKARQRDVDVNQLERWHQQGVLQICMAGTAWHEAQAGEDQLRIRKAGQQIYTATEAVEPTSVEFRRVESVLFPEGANTQNKRNDVRIVCDAAKYGAILVTNDGGSKKQPGGILGNRDRLGGSPVIKSPKEMVAYVKQKISERDQFNQAIHLHTGQSLPDWDGQH